MKFFSYLATLLLMVSCASKHPNSRTLSSVEKDLTGHYLGVADYKSPHPGPNKAAIRIYFHPTEGEPGKYTAVLVEYVDLLKMAPSYIISNKLPFLAKRVGFLNSISRNISAYEVNPGVKENTFELWPLSVEGDQIVAKKEGQPRILTLDESEGLKNVMEGATISSVNPGEPKEIFFPKKDDKKRNGIQYGTAKLAYSKAKLDSTWRKQHLRGPYLSQYAKKATRHHSSLTKNTARVRPPAASAFSQIRSPRSSKANSKRSSHGMGCSYCNQRTATRRPLPSCTVALVCSSTCSMRPSHWAKTWLKWRSSIRPIRKTS
jgi:hypothetical protein